MAIKKVKNVPVTSAIFKTIYTTPIQVMGAPASGYARVYLSIANDFVYGGIQYAGASVIGFYTVGPVGLAANTPYSIYRDISVFLGTQDINNALLKPNSGAVTLGLLCTTRPLYFSADANPTLGNSPMNFYIVYEDILIDP